MALIKPDLTYSLDAVCDSYNDLIDLKAWGAVFQRTDFPLRLLPSPAPVCLGTMLIDIAEDGSVSSCSIEHPAGMPILPMKSGYMWVNIERPSWPSPLHSNILLWSGGKVVRFEPHGADPTLMQHAACGFRNYYVAEAVDHAIESALLSYGLVSHIAAFYMGVDKRWPLLGQSFSTNDGCLNTHPLHPGQAFKRTGAVTGSGDNFCGMWTLLFLVHALSSSPDDAMALCSFSKSPGDSSCLSEHVGGKSADLIASFILRVHSIYADDIAKMNLDEEWASMG
jgi:hypothetical protein